LGKGKLLKFENDKQRFAWKRHGEADTVDLKEFKDKMSATKGRKVYEFSYAEFREYMMCLRISNPEHEHLREINHMYLTRRDYQILMETKNPEVKALSMIEELNEYVAEVEAEMKEAQDHKDNGEILKLKSRYSFKKWIEDLFRMKMREEIGS
jgi:hypothetical protein